MDIKNKWIKRKYYIINSSQLTTKSQLNLQRKEYETIIKRHLGFIDKLLSEKEALGQKCETLSDSVKLLEKEFTTKIKLTLEAHARDFKSQRDIVLQQEKLKRDKWIQDKTKIIKDQTVKGLEPEIQNLISQHKLQMRQLEEQYHQQLLTEKSFHMEQTQKQLVKIFKF